MKINVNPVYKKELIGMSRSVRFPLMVFLINAILAFIVCATYFGRYYSGECTIYLEEYAEIIEILEVVLAIEVALMLLLIPSAAIAEEREKLTFEMLITSDFPFIRIVLGKLFASMTIMVSFLFSTLPMLIALFSVYHLKIKFFILFVLTCMVVWLFIASFSMLMCAKAKSAKNANATGIVAVICIVLISIIVVYLVYAIRYFIANYDYFFNDGRHVTGINSGAEKYLMFLNPVALVFAVLTKLMGNYEVFNTIIDHALPELQNYETFAIDNWIIISLILQMLMTVLFIWLTAKRIDPLSDKRKYLKTLRADEEVPDSATDS